MQRTLSHGIPVVAFANPAESEIIENNVTGILVKTEEEYVKAIEYLHDHPVERQRMGQNAKAYVENQLAPQKCFEDLNNVYKELMLMPKKGRTYFNCSETAHIGYADGKDLGARLLIESLGESGPEFVQSYENNSQYNIREIDGQIANVELAMKTKTKGSLNQYLYFFPHDPYLNFWAGLIAQNENRHEDAVILFRRALEFGKHIERVRDYLNKSVSKI